MFATQLSTGSCGVGAWQTNSQTVHWVSSHPTTGPWVRKEVVLAPEATCASTAMAPDGALVMTLFGGRRHDVRQRVPAEYPHGDPVHHQFCRNGSSPCGFSKHGCTNGTSRRAAVEATLASPPPLSPSPQSPPLSSPSSQSPPSSSPSPAISTLSLPDCAHCTPATCTQRCSFPYYASPGGLAGPWSLRTAELQLALNFSGQFSISAPWVSANGTTHIVLQTGDWPAFYPEHLRGENIGAVVRAESWAGPYTVVARGACGPGEDMFLWRDPRGHFHCLWHSTVRQQSVHQVEGCCAVL